MKYILTWLLSCASLVAQSVAGGTNPCLTCKPCIAEDNPTQAGVDDKTCKNCALGAQGWWPCNTEVPQCRCSPDAAHDLAPVPLGAIGENPCADCHSCIAEESPTQAMVFNHTCAPCARDRKTDWPCNTVVPQCRCRPDAVGVAHDLAPGPLGAIGENPCADCHRCIAEESPTQAMVFNHTCAPCARDAKTDWPCNDVVPQCRCSLDGTVRQGSTNSTPNPVAASFLSAAPVVASSFIFAVAAAGLIAAVAAALRRRRRNRKGEEGPPGQKSDIETPPVSRHDASDPAWAAVSLEQLNHLRDHARQLLGSSYPMATMHDINKHILQPLCGQHGKSYAHIINSEGELKLTDVFVSHAWLENFDDFVNAVNLPFQAWKTKPNLWICALALEQSEVPERVAAQVSVDPFEAPFTKALSKAGHILVVRNIAVDLYTRVWCCWELFLAHRLHLVDKAGGVIVTGPQQPVQSQPADIMHATAHRQEDKDEILKAMFNTGISSIEVNDLLNEIRTQANF